MKITNDVKYIGVNDYKIDLFEGKYVVPNGMAYNSYLIVDEKIAVLDTVDASFGEEWLRNIENEIGERSPDYLIVHHMEPDHSSNIKSFAEKYPNATVVASDKAFVYMKQFYGDDYADRRIVVGEGDTLSLGKHTLSFFTAPMVHWPEVVVSYDSFDKIVFSADAFGKFGALDAKEEWADEARRYYFGIVGKYGAQAQRLLLKLGGLDVKIICSLHGPVLCDNLDKYIELYKTWTSYKPEEEGVFIAYTSVYGNTKKAALLLYDELKALGVKVKIADLARSDISKAIEDSFRFSKLVLATTTYNAEIFPFMRELICELRERGFQNRKIGIIENGSWAPVAAKTIKSMFESSKNITFAENTVTVRSAMSEENKQEIKALALELSK